MTMVEKIARAIADANGDDFATLAENRAALRREWEKGDIYYALAQGKYGFHQSDYLDMARAALEAMKEPSEEMIFAGWYRAPLGKIHADHLRQIYPAMIDFALKEGETT